MSAWMMIALSDIACDTEEVLRLVHSCCIHSSKQAPTNVSSMMQ